MGGQRHKAGLLLSQMAFLQRCYREDAWRLWQICNEQDRGETGREIVDLASGNWQLAKLGAGQRVSRNVCAFCNFSESREGEQVDCVVQIDV